VFCQLARLRRCLSPRIRRALEELPETLDETYERTLLDIDDENWEYAHRLFQCIVVARRPLHVEELAEFLAFKSETGGSLTFEGNWRPENARDTVLSTCSSLIAIVDVEGSRVIQFSHFSVKEYLTSNRTAKGRVSRYYIPLEPAHLFVTQACLSLLLQLDNHVTKETIEEFPLARYAGQYWTDHAEFGNVSSHTEDLMKRVFHPEDHHFANWVWIYDTIWSRSMPSEGPSRPGSSPLHYAARHGFHRVVEWLIISCSQGVNVSSGRWRTTPLHIASIYEQFTVLQILLTHHADVNARDSDDQSPLHYLLQRKHLKVVRLLLEHGADVNSKAMDHGFTPLRLLSGIDGDVEVAQVLLEHGADPNVRSSTGRDSLYMALEMGYQGLAQLLLKHGANPNTRDVDDKTLLHVASELGNTEVAQGLLELNVDVNSRDNEGRTPLQVALQNGEEKVAEILLQHGAKRT
jgi:Ankyrin repeats (3 copies)/Ankyrin repeat